MECVSALKVEKHGLYLKINNILPSSVAHRNIAR